MPESEPNPGWKPSTPALIALIVAALALAGATCWVFKIDPLPTPGHVQDPGWFLTFALVYFFALYFAVARVLRHRQ